MDRRLATGMLALGLPALAAFGYAVETGRIAILPGALPETGDLPPVPSVIRAGAAVPGLTRAAFDEGVTFLNIWASWCPYCRNEHDLLMRLSERPGIRLFGLVADDTETNAAAFLEKLGNPFSRLSVDHARVYLRALRQRGVPSTYLFAKGGALLAKVPGELTRASLTGQLLPAFEKAVSA